MNTKIKYTLLLILAVSSCRLSVAQSVIDLIKQRPSYASCNYDVYPDSITAKLTPAPAGKKPFYISHYGRHGSRYISNRSGFDTPYFMMLHADSLDELTPTGKQVLRHMNNIMRNTEGRWGELTGYGKQQMQNIGRRMAERFPEVFHPGANVTCISTVVPRCIESMGSLAMEMLQVCPQLHITMQASKRTQWYMNYQDKKLRKSYMTPEAQKALDAYTATRMGNTRLMELIFKNPDIAEEFVNQEDFSYYLMKMGLFQLNTNFNRNTNLIGLFNTNDLYRMWQVDNAYWYLQHGACKLNGGNQPYTQRHLLKKMIADADSCIKLPDPGAQLRFGHETVLLPLVCLIGVNGFDFSTDNLDELESHGWWCSSVFPMAGNLQFIFYRSNPKDKDVLVKVLLNEVEATLPISTDCAPYYHWSDFRQYCLNKLAAYKQ
ncbi:Histidine phosphatase superfamily (branch 2) [Xylanibacter ruminicola]|uniref:histidine-type phosphatase n=1 Tax=Xylanibacter ruminicola TaxID=839 RepID=UPI0008ED8736|nr:histidine-type phosphatase [Xylanibacter ruminicola]SFC65843.1 Histidine phosphatase superfamily (branch 2) [Xylanibacter ruminicola]